MSWTSLLANPSGIERIYEGRVPDLTGVHFHSVELNREGPSLLLRFDMPSYPENPPHKWQKQGFNVVQMTLGLSGVEEPTLHGFAIDPVADISLRSQERITLDVHSASLRLHATAATVYVANISAYRACPE
ncbi:Imm50 family immunity protein [Streptomyces sp. NPDC058084]|uniref:Imm50 family immunity protein n=1 Tax=Streptomyces sp. NPDC058084 TaxID=3346333 RepID=UPI0036E8B574